jgi:hypothetical protein
MPLLSSSVQLTFCGGAPPQNKSQFIRCFMSIFDIFKRKKADRVDPSESYEDLIGRHLAEFSEEDYLGKAAVAGGKAHIAKAAGNFDAAWRSYQEMKIFYSQHAARCNFTAAETLALDACVSQPMADILRLEGKHHDALVHIMYGSSPVGVGKV